MSDADGVRVPGWVVQGLVGALVLGVAGWSVKSLVEMQATMAGMEEKLRQLPAINDELKALRATMTKIETGQEGQRVRDEGQQRQIDDLRMRIDRSQIKGDAPLLMTPGQPG